MLLIFALLFYPSLDKEELRGVILSNDDPLTLPQTNTCIECSYMKVNSLDCNLGGLKNSDSDTYFIFF